MVIECKLTIIPSPHNILSIQKTTLICGDVKSFVVTVVGKGDAGEPENLIDDTDSILHLLLRDPPPDSSFAPRVRVPLAKSLSGRAHNDALLG